MSEQRQAETSGFGAYLLDAMTASGYRTPTALARAADLSPSVILRWACNEVVPSVPVLKRVAPLLGVSSADLIAQAYPTGVTDLPGPPPPREIAALIRAFNAVDDPAERRQLLERVNWIVEWSVLRRGKG